MDLGRYGVRMTRVVVRPRIKMVLFIIVSDVFALAGLSYLAKGQVFADRNVLGIGLGFLLTLIGAVGVWRALRLGVVIDQSGLRVRRFAAGDRLLTWTDVQSIGCEKIFLRGGRPFYAPVLHLAGIGRVAAQELGSHALEEAEQKAADLRGLQLAAPSHGPLVIQNG